MNLARVLTFLALLMLTGCNLPQASPVPPLEAQAATLVAATLNARTMMATPTAAQSMPTLAPTATLPPTATITPTYATPLLKISEDTNCRTGPGQDYEIVTVIKAGKQVEIIGRPPTGNYWVVKNPANSNPCWVWGEYATPSGSIHILPSITPPPTATPGLPAAPSNLRYEFNCAYNGVGTDVTTTLEWNDNARNEKGYRVYRNGSFAIELPPNSTTFAETAAIPLGATMTYSVEAFNDTGPSARASISFTCP
jgi:uncharacterized protein YraI